MEEKFTIAEFANYLAKQESMGDALYFLNAHNVREAQMAYCKHCRRFEKCREEFLKRMTLVLSRLTLQIK